MFDILENLCGEITEAYRGSFEGEYNLDLKKANR